MNAQISKKIPFLNNAVFVTFLLLPYFKPASLQYIAPQLENVFNILKIFSLVVGLGLYIYKRKISKTILAIIIYEVVLFACTFINDGDYWSILVNCGSIVSFSMLMELGIKNDCRVVFKSIFFIYFIFVLVNLILIFMYPDGLAHDTYYYNKYNFLAIDNGLSPIFIPVISLSIIYAEFNKKASSLNFVLLVMISITVIITWSATGVMMWFLMMLYVVFVYRKKLMSVLNIKVLYIAFAVLEIAIVFFRVQEIFAYIIEDILGKSLTFTGRTIIWDSSMGLIRNSPFIGYGVYEGHGLILYGGKYMYAHNGVLEILLQGGIIALIAYVSVFVISGNILYKYRNNRIAGIISAAIFSMLTGMLMESFHNSILLYALLISACCMPEIIEQYENNTVKPTSFLLKLKANKYKR